MRSPRLSADCGRCAALCCVALDFDRSPQFGFDKAAGVACAHLGPRHRCTIHADLTGSGFSGCARYDCLGAGQRVVQEVFAGQSANDAALLPRMLEAFLSLRQVHELLLLLETARRLPLPPAVEERRQALWQRLCPAQGFSEASLAVFDHSEASHAVMFFLGSLREHVPATSRRGRRLPVLYGGVRCR